MYIVIEGQDATGKSTQVELLAEHLRKTGKPVITMHEPDGDLESAHELRRIIKDKKYNLEPFTHVLLFTAARQELWCKLAEPVLREGGYVISARNWWSTLAYQGYARGLDKDLCNQLSLIAQSGIKIDLTIFLDLNPLDGFKRKGGADKGDRLEQETLDFHQKVYGGFCDIAKNNPNRYAVIHAKQSKEEVLSSVINALKNKGIID
jgi:dTMP kinase